MDRLEEELKQMNISDLMQFLAEVKEKYGDLPVFCTTLGVGFLAEEEELSKSVIEIVDRNEQKALIIGY